MLPRPTASPTYCGGARATADRHAGDGGSSQLERLLVQQPDPVLAGTLGECLAEAEIVVSVHRRERGDVRRGETGEHVREIARVRELDDIAQQQDQIDRLSENHSSAESVRRSRCSGSKTLIQRDPADSSSQWRSLRTPMRIVKG